MKVWFDHRVIAEHPDDHAHLTVGMLRERWPGREGWLAGRDEEDLLILRRAPWKRDTEEETIALIVASYPYGSYHAAGIGFACAFAAPKDDCPNCNASLRED